MSNISDSDINAIIENANAQLKEARYHADIARRIWQGIAHTGMPYKIATIQYATDKLGVSDMMQRVAACAKYYVMHRVVRCLGEPMSDKEVIEAWRE